jgi:HK97 family phage portal protein
MNLKFWEKSNPKAEVKSYTGTSHDVNCAGDYYSLINALSGMTGVGDISALVMWSWYKRVSPMRHGTDLISQNFSEILPAIYDTEEDRYLVKGQDDVPYMRFVEKLYKPNGFQSRIKFAESFCPSYLVTGNYYIIASAMDEDSEIQYLTYIPPQDVTPLEGSKGIITSYSVTNSTFSANFKVKEIGDFQDEVIYITDDETQELIPMAKFNPNSNPTCGLSPLSSVVPEIEQYYHGNTHNNKFLETGARPSGMILIPADVNLSQEQENRLRDKVEKSGGENTGKVLVVQGGTDYKELSVNNKDMDYINLMERAKMEISTSLNIPLPLISNKAMTMNNYSESKYMLFDMAVIPLAKLFYSELDRKVSRRYENEDGRYVLTFDRKRIEALQVRENAEVTRKAESGVYTKNEVRDLFDLKERPDGDVYHQKGSAVIGQAPSEEKPEVKSSKDLYKEALKKFDKYTDEEIEKKAVELYG